MKMLRKRIVHVSVLIMFLLCVCCGCTNEKTVVDEKYIEDELQERYGMEFVCDSLNYSQHMYKAICHPVEDASLQFSCMYGVDGSLGYDFYVGAIIAREESKSFSDYIGEGLGESYVRCANALIIDEGVPGRIESNVAICDLIKENSFTIQKAYEIDPIDSLFFNIYVNNSICGDDYGKEYDIIEEAVEKMVSKYEKLYGLEIFIDMDVFFLNDQYYQQLVDGNFEINEDLRELLDHSAKVSLQMGIPKDYVTKDLWLCREEYISARENMR